MYKLLILNKLFIYAKIPREKSRSILQSNCRIYRAIAKYLREKIISLRTEVHDVQP